MNFAIEIIIITFLALLLMYKLSTRNYDYWKKRKVEHVKPVPIIGNFWKVLTLQATYYEHLSVMYNKFKTPYFGIYILNWPGLVVRDPELIKQVLAKNFSHFSNRSIYTNEKCDPLLSKTLFAINNPEWRQLRKQMNSFFTKKRISNMTGLIEEAARDMQLYIEQNLHRNYIEVKNMSVKYTTDVIASCALGVKANSFQDPCSELSAIGSKCFDFGFINAFRQSCYFVAPAIVEFFRLPFLDPAVSGFFRKVFWETVNERIRSKNNRHDIIDIILELMDDSTTNMKKFDNDTVLAQAFIIFFGGLETSSTTIAFTFYELAQNPDVQTKLRKELQSAAVRSKLLTYDTIHSLKYLDMIVSETLRKYPPVPFLERICTKEYQVPQSDLIIEPGTPVLVSNFALSRDVEYFPEAERYDPERFSDLNKKTSNCFSLPFGLGPRDCIGKMFGTTAVKLAVASVILNYEVETCAETPSPIQFKVAAFLLKSSGGLPLRFRKIFNYSLFTAYLSASDIK